MSMFRPRDDDDEEFYDSRAGLTPVEEWRYTRNIERFVNGAVTLLAYGFIWAGLRAWRELGDTSMLVTSMFITVGLALAAPRISSFAVRHMIRGGQSWDYAWAAWSEPLTEEWGGNLDALDFRAGRTTLDGHGDTLALEPLDDDDEFYNEDPA